MLIWENIEWGKDKPSLPTEIMEGDIAPIFVPYLAYFLRELFILLPIHRVGEDVLVFCLIIPLVSDNVFVIIPLPEAVLKSRPKPISNSF